MTCKMVEIPSSSHSVFFPCRTSGPGESFQPAHRPWEDPESQRKGEYTHATCTHSSVYSNTCCEAVEALQLLTTLTAFTPFCWVCSVNTQMRVCTQTRRAHCVVGMLTLVHTECQRRGFDKLVNVLIYWLHCIVFKYVYGLVSPHCDCWNNTMLEPAHLPHLSVASHRPSSPTLLSIPFRFSSLLLAFLRELAPRPSSLSWALPLLTSSQPAEQTGRQRQKRPNTGRGPQPCRPPQRMNA